MSLVGDAFRRLDEISAELEHNERCRIRLGACDVTNRYDKEKEREYINFTLFGFKFPDEEESDGDKDKKSENSKKAAKKSSPKGAGKKKNAPPPLEDEDSEEDGENLPF